MRAHRSRTPLLRTGQRHEPGRSPAGGALGRARLSAAPPAHKLACSHCRLRPELPWPSSLDTVDAGDFGKRYHFDNSASKRELGLHYAPDAEVLERTLACMVDSGFVTPRRSKL